MGFNNCYVDLFVNSKTINRYEPLGYVMPKKYNEKKKKIVYDTSKTVQINVKDLSPDSSAKIDYSCDNCGKNMAVIWRNYLRFNLDGKYYCKECKIGHPQFVKWIKPRNKTSQSRSSSEYSLFVRTVLKRDNYTCQCCGVKYQDKNLEIHHLNGYRWFVEGRTDPANGITLCNKKSNGCHENFHILYGKIKNTKEQFEEWIGHRLENLDKYEMVSELPQVYCIEDDSIYEDIHKCAEIIGCSSSYVYQMCHGTRRTYNGKHYVYYDNYLKMSKEDIKQLFTNNYIYKNIINLELGYCFNSTKEACKKFNMTSDKNMSACCNKRRKHAGKYNNIKLSWIWFDDYIKLSDDTKINLIEKHLETLEKESFLMQQYDLLKNNAA